MGKNNKQANVFDKPKQEVIEQSPEQLQDDIEQEQPEQPDQEQDDSKTALQQLQERKAELEKSIAAFEGKIKSGKMSFADAMKQAVMHQSELDSVERDISKDTLRGDVVGKVATILDHAKYQPALILIKIEKTEDGRHYTTHFDSEVPEALKAKSTGSKGGTGRSSAIWTHNDAGTEHKPAELFATVRDDSKVTDTMRNKADKYRQWELLLADLHKVGLLTDYSHKK